MFGLLDNLAQFLNIGDCGIDSGEFGLGYRGYTIGQGGLAASGRPVKDKGGQPVRFNRPAQELALADNMRLAGIFIQALGPHPRRQGQGFSVYGFCLFLK